MVLGKLQKHRVFPLQAPRPAGPARQRILTRQFSAVSQGPDIVENIHARTSLSVQEFRLCALKEGGMGSNPG